MIINEETFGFMKTASMIRSVQEMHIEYEEAVKKKRDKLKKYKEMKKVMNGLKYILQDRLRKMNRYDPLFFSLGALVEYNNPGFAVKLGKVVGHEEKLVQVQFEGEVYQTKVEPGHLTLLYIRNKYY